MNLSFPLLLDRITPRLAGLNIQAGGRLVFDPRAGQVRLVTQFVRIEAGGALEAGSEECPFTGEAEILLTGLRGGADGVKFLSVERGGRLELHGRPALPWTRLAATASPGSRQLQLDQEPLGWRPGDRVVVAASGEDMAEAEEVELVGCVDRQCRLARPLRHLHHGGPGQLGLDLRAEVGLLSRNIVVRGELEQQCYGPLCDTFPFDTFGGHVIAREGFKRDGALVSVAGHGEQSGLVWCSRSSHG